MDYNVSSKQEQRGILAGMLLGNARKRDRNFAIVDSPRHRAYLLFKKTLLENITRKPAFLRESRNHQGKSVLRLEPKLIPLTRVLVQKLYVENRQRIARRFLEFLTPQGIAIWFMDKGGKSFKRKAGKIRAIEITLNTHLSAAANEIIAGYFAEVWGFNWGLSKSRGTYRLRLGTRAGKAFLAFLKPYIHPSMLYKINTSYNTTAAT